MRYYDGSGKSIEIGQQLGRGGEGSVYSLATDPNLVAKVYHKPPDREQSAKITTMTRKGTERLIRLSAWPVNTLFDRPGGLVTGFLMPKVVGYKEIHTLYSPKDRIANFPNAGWPFLIHTAANIARAFAAVHEHGHVVGDVNHGNVVVSNQATVMLIDCDSFQIVEQGHHFLCGVGVSTHTPPELQNKPFQGVIRTPNHDAFGLAVLVFQLLFMGRHPFSGRYLGAGEMPLEKAITEYRFAYSANANGHQMRQPPGTLTLSTVSPGVAALFERAFGRGGARPTPQEWVTALTELAKSLQRCPKNSGHDYIRSAASCPLCEIEGQSGIRLFNIVILGTFQPGVTLDLGLLWSQIESVAPPPDEPFPSTAPVVDVSPEISRLGKQQRVKTRLTWFGAVLLSTVMISNGVNAAFWWIAVIFVFSACFGKAETKEFTAAKSEAKRRAGLHQEELKKMTDRWQRAAVSTPFDEAKREFFQKREKLSNLASERQRLLQELTTKSEQKQRQKYLDRFNLAGSNIPGIGASRKATLVSYGIETAADVEWNAIELIPGFGPTLTGQLVEWRNGLEKSFRFNPNQGIDPSDVAALENDIANRRSKIESELQQGPETLSRIKQHILRERSALTPLIKSAAQAAAQAEAEVKAL